MLKRQGFRILICLMNDGGHGSGFHRVAQTGWWSSKRPLDIIPRNYIVVALRLAADALIRCSGRSGKRRSRRRWRTSPQRQDTVSKPQTAQACLRWWSAGEAPSPTSLGTRRRGGVPSSESPPTGERAYVTGPRGRTSLGPRRLLGAPFFGTEKEAKGFPNPTTSDRRSVGFDLTAHRYQCAT
jgi:hypothetical protein